MAVAVGVAARVLIVGNGILPSSATIDREVAWADRVIGADGGADKLHRAGHAVDEVVGDLDSLTEEAARRLGASKVHKDSDPNTTDLDKCLARALGSGAQEVHIIGTTAGRTDHVLGSFASLGALPGSADVRLVDDMFEAWRVRDVARFEALEGTVVSLLTPSGARGVSTQGLKWPLRDAELRFSTVGLSNVVVSNPVEVRVREGLLFLLKGRFLEGAN